MRRWAREGQALQNSLTNSPTISIFLPHTKREKIASDQGGNVNCGDMHPDAKVQNNVWAVHAYYTRSRWSATQGKNAFGTRSYKQLHTNLHTFFPYAVLFTVVISAVWAT